MLGQLHQLAKGNNLPRIYYSAYSPYEKFRKRWLPKAHSFGIGMRFLQEWQYMGGECRLHFCFIEGENDSVSDVEHLCQAIYDHKIHANVNIVRYNPPNDKSRESTEEVIERNVKIIKERMPYSQVKVIPRVGLDVFASCGTFIT